MREFLFAHRRVLNHLESSPDPESPYKTPLITIFIKAKRFKDEGPPVSVPELPEISAPSSPKNFPTPKKYFKTRQKLTDGSMWESKLTLKQAYELDTLSLTKNEFSVNGHSNSDVSSAVCKKYSVFPSSFKVKKTSKTANSVYYPVCPDRLFLSNIQTTETKKRSYKNNQAASTTPTPQSRKPNFISKSSYKANFFSSKIDKVLQRYKTNSTKASAKKIALVKHQRRKSDQLFTKEISFSGSSRSSGTNSNSSIGRGVVIKHYPKSGNNSINLDLSKVHIAQVPCVKNNSARHLEHRRANTFYMQRSKERLVDSRTGRDKKENLTLFKETKLIPAPEVGSAGVSRFVERMVLAEQKMNYFYKK